VVGGVVAAMTLAACSAPSASVTGVSATATQAPKVTLDQSDQAPSPSSLAEVIKRVLPSVVNVRVTGVASDPFGGSQEFQGEGSGAVIARDGIILTNNHVIEGAVKVEVVFTDGRDSLQGTVIGADPTHDLAVVKVDANDLTPIAIGKSGELELGDEVAAIGFPLDLGGPTVTQGIVSGLNRTIDVQKGSGGTEHLVGLLQTDAAINPGNSGGPLINALGQLVGINTAGVSAGSAENVGFAIAIDGALPIVHQIIDEPASQRAWLGVSAASVDSATIASQLGVPTDTRGAAIVDVVPGGPAASAGLQSNDVIVSIDGKDVRSAEDLSTLLASLRPGDRVSVDVVSANGSRSVDVTLGQRPSGV
jgi:putative serine protease PepD